ncbi:B12-binding domain-containing radical SAM protein [Candidatus Desulfarcum epimagneticum]|uniref:B12-binding domain-containing radical SAM protein n=1 Tax=uncultured Desulfobacteraceae bacterium TaxID=218296 RepID=A0A484HKZ1_9BACT|nr:B12-binding domain-containing radical SAM protein [uncultured Desulfobacteraceae bacterium]
MIRDVPHILFVNPWIHDFAAYDFWAKPLGLLSLAAIARRHGFQVSYIDCLDRFHARAPLSDPRARFGRGPYLKTPIAKPPGLENIPRTFSRYGIKKRWLSRDLDEMPRPDLIMVTSMMTYWYPGVFETISAVREKFPGVPTALGGVFATLLHEFAVEKSGADRVFAGEGEKALLEIIGRETGFSVSPRFDFDDPDAFPRPAFDLQNAVGYVPLRTSSGCPFSCPYCASGILNPRRFFKSPGAVVDEIAFWRRTWGVEDFVFYDDALLADSGTHAAPLFETIIQKTPGLRFHTPNALHVREITDKIAALMFRAGFKTLRLGFETAERDGPGRFDGKTSSAELVSAVSSLKKAGFEAKQAGVYLLAGMPGLDMDSVFRSIEVVKAAGATPIPAYYSPIPRTRMWEKAQKASRYDLEADPVFSNNALLPCRTENFSWEDLTRLKNRCKT